MRLAWILLAALVAVIVNGTNWSSSTDATPSTTEATGDTDLKTTTEAGGDDGGVNTASTTAKPENTGSTAAPGETTDGPVKTDAPEPTDDGSTDKTPKPEKTTVKVVDTTTTTKKAVSTTTKEPQPNVENFSVTCSKQTPSICTYTMQVPGLDIDTFDRLMRETNDTETDVNNYESTDLVNLQAGVTKVFDDAKATVDYVESQLADITAEIAYLQVQATQLENDIDDVNTAVATATNYLNKILNKKGSCLYRQCVLKEPTTTRPVTTTTARTTKTPFCSIPENKDTCQHGGKCSNWYDSYRCTCTGNLDGDQYDCNTSVCDIIKDPQAPGLIYSPGYNGTNNAEGDCDGAQWTVKAMSTDPKAFLNLESSGSTNITQLSADANLQLTVGKYKLKITSKTKYNQITQILGYGPTATISYSGPAKDFFYFTITEEVPPTVPTTPKKD